MCLNRSSYATWLVCIGYGLIRHGGESETMGRFESGHEGYTDVRLARMNVVADEAASRYGNGTMQGSELGPGLR